MPTVEQRATPGTTAEFLEPARIVKYFDLKPGDHVADFGAGHGYFTIPLAQVVGGDGKVYAIDIQRSVLDIIRSRAKLENLFNIEPVWADLDAAQGSGLRERFLDLVLVSNILFQAEQKLNVLTEAYRVLREGGKLALIEWDALPTPPSPIGPPPTLRIRAEEAKRLALQAGFTLEREFEAGPHHYGLLFVKK